MRGESVIEGQELMLHELTTHDHDQDGVRTIVIGSDQPGNRLDLDGLDDLLQRLVRADEDPGVRAVVLTGHPPSFCSGASGKFLLTLLEPAEQQRLLDVVGPRYLRALQMATPVVAAIGGATAGVGLCLALIADVRIIADRAVLSAAFSRYGLPGEYAAAWLLPRLVGQGAAADLLLSARMVTAGEALQIGLAQRMVRFDELHRVAMAYARTLATRCDPVAMAETKAALLRGHEQPLAQAMEESLAAMRVGLTSEAFRTAITRPSTTLE
jgi:enoyl-CoA hydratase/carnithine racemase